MLWVVHKTQNLHEEIRMNFTDNDLQTILLSDLPKRLKLEILGQDISGVRGIQALYQKMESIVQGSCSWSSKGDPFWRVHRVMQGCLCDELRWYDPNRDDEEDIMACFNAWTDKMEEVTKPENAWMIT